MASVFCAKCGHQNPADGRFCGRCGAPLAGPEPVAGEPAADVTSTLSIAGLEVDDRDDLAAELLGDQLPSGFALLAIVPLYVAILSMLLPRGEKLLMRGWLGLALGFVGLAALLWPGIRQANAQHQQVLGCVIVLCGAFFWAVGSVLSRELKLPVNPMVAAGWEMLAAGTITAPAPEGQRISLPTWIPGRSWPPATRICAIHPPAPSRCCWRWWRSTSSTWTRP